MKKYISIVLLIIMALMLGACSSKADSPKLLTKEGIAPYELSESENFLLQSFGMIDKSQIITYNAPKEAISLNINAYRLGDDEKWISTGGGGISLGADRESDGKLVGTFAMQLLEDYVIDFFINDSGLASFSTDKIVLDSEQMGSIKGFLQDFQDIVLNTEIPVAFMVYDSGTRLEMHSLEDYFDPSAFAGMDLVQFVTLEFLDK